MLPRSAILLVPLALSACEPDETPGVPECVDLSFDVETCAPLYLPKFDDVYANSIDGSCDSVGTSCHAQSDASGAVHGLVLASADGSHAALMGEVDDRPFVNVENPSCSVLMVRLATQDEDIRMPPGEFARPDPELCAIAKWMAEGASR